MTTGWAADGPLYKMRKKKGKKSDANQASDDENGKKGGPTFEGGSQIIVEKINSKKEEL